MSIHLNTDAWAVIAILFTVFVVLLLLSRRRSS